MPHRLLSILCGCLPTSRKGSVTPSHIHNKTGFIGLSHFFKPSTSTTVLRHQKERRYTSATYLECANPLPTGSSSCARNFFYDVVWQFCFQAKHSRTALWYPSRFSDDNKKLYICSFSYIYLQKKYLASPLPKRIRFWSPRLFFTANSVLVCKAAGSPPPISKGRILQVIITKQASIKKEKSGRN